MIPIVGAFRGLFLGSVLLWYSSSVWKTMDNYYNHEFKKYLQKEKEARRLPIDEGMCRAAEGQETPTSCRADAAAVAAAADAVTTAVPNAPDAVAPEGDGGSENEGTVTASVASDDSCASVDGSAIDGGTLNRDGTCERRVIGTEEQRKIETEDGLEAMDDVCPAVF